MAGNSNIFETPQFQFTTNTAYYVTLYPTNSAGLEGVLVAPPVYFDTSPPVFQGSIRVLPNSISTNFTSLTELDEATANSMTVGCLLDSDLAVVHFEEATDPETEVDR